jgi:peroxiredoxin
MIKALFICLCFLTFPIAFTIAQTYEDHYQKCKQTFKLTDAPDAWPDESLESMDSCLIGAIAPKFHEKTVDGKIIELSKLKGKVVVLTFWAIGCHPCVEEIPQLNKLVKLYRGKSVTFISLADDNPASLTKFFKKHPFKYLTIANSEQIMKSTFKLMSLFPYTIILDKEGHIFKMRIGGFGNQKEVVPFYQNIIDQALK